MNPHEEEMMSSAKLFIMALGWYAELGGQPCAVTEAIGGAARAAGISQEEMTDIYLAGRRECAACAEVDQAAYWMGHVAHILCSGGSLAYHQAPVQRWGHFDHLPEYLKGWQAAQAAAQTILSIGGEP